MRLAKSRISRITAKKVTADVLLAWSTPANAEIRQLQLILLWTAHGWRVDDIATSDVASLRKFLQ